MKKLILLTLMMVALASGMVSAQTYSLRSSVTMLGTATPNIEFSMPVTKKVSVHLPILYNPWVMKENSRFQLLAFMPGVRLWRQQVGVHYF